MSAYFVTDENGNIREVYSNEELQESYQQVFPVVPPVDEQADYVPYHEDDVVSDSSQDEMMTVSSGDVSGGDYVTSVPVPSPDYNELYQLMSTASLVDLYPNNSAVQVFTDVLNGLDDEPYYFIQSGSDNNTAYLYYAEHATIRGKNVTLESPVYVCEYSQYREYVGQQWVNHYQYKTSSTGDMTFNPSTQLVYTNTIDGYPDVVNRSPRENNFFGLALVLLLAVVLVKIMIGGKVK